ncbi:MAG: hypothetical protein KBA06_04485 [Saprospiraceae bacterium]|nr:hypothetical protein [Saprospiraceae bacterium]
MKRILFSLIAFAFISTLSLTFESCQTDPCKNVTCGDHGQCFEGTCTCDVGYEKDSQGKCTVLSQTKFLGTYAVSELCGGQTFNYTTTVTASTTDVTKILIKNLGNYDCSTGEYFVIADISGSSVTVPSQVVCSTTFSGSGTYDASSNKLVISYSATYNPGTGTVTDNCTSTMTKQ